MNGPTPDQKEAAERSRFDHLYLWLDYVGKIAKEARHDLVSFLIVFFGTFVSLMGRWLSAVLVWTGTRSPQKVHLPLNLFKILLQSTLVITTAIFAFLITLIAGTLSAMLGVRNIADYSFKEQCAVWIALVIFVFSLPFFVSPYVLFKLSLVFAYAIGVLGLDFLYGQCGILSLGHAGFLLLGGYITTWFANGFFGFEFPILASIIFSASLMGLVGIVLGAPSLRIKDYYLVIMTMTFSLAIPKILKSPHLKAYSGLREGGIQIRAMQINPDFKFLTPEFINYYFVATATLILFTFAYYLIYHSQIGRAFKTIKCDNEVSMIMGIPVVKFKLLAFCLSAIYAGFCGGLLDLLTKFVHPDIYNARTSINFVVANVVGGPGSLLGSLLGGVFLAYEPDFTHKMGEWIPRGKDLATACYGIILILAVLFVPRGIAGQLSVWIKTKLQGSGRRGLYQFNPPPDYDYLPEDKSKSQLG